MTLDTQYYFTENFSEGLVPFGRAIGKKWGTWIGPQHTDRTRALTGAGGFSKGNRSRPRGGKRAHVNKAEKITDKVCSRSAAQRVRTGSPTAR